MQTFLPYASFAESARCLDDKRLGKQRVECAQILGALLSKKITSRGVTTSESESWVNHPVVRMWRGHELWLVEYAIACCDAWVARGFKDSLKPVFLSLALPPSPMPPWIGGPIHASHRAALLEKERWDLFLDHYVYFGWDDEWRGYFWPVGSKESSACRS